MSTPKAGRYSQLWILAGGLAVMLGIYTLHSVFSNRTDTPATIWNAIAAWVTAVTTIGLLVAAFKALNSWRSQTAGQATITLLLNLVEAAYELRNAIDAFRIGLFPEKDEQGQGNQYVAENAHDRFLEVLNAKWNKLNPPFARFESLVLQASMLIGNQEFSAAEPVLRIRTEMVQASRDRLRLLDSVVPPEERAKINKKVDSIFSKLVSVLDQESYNKEIENRIEAFLTQVKTIYAKAISDNRA